jgi:hypothetical protein
MSLQIVGGLVKPSVEADAGSFAEMIRDGY